MFVAIIVLDVDVNLVLLVLCVFIRLPKSCIFIFECPTIHRFLVSRANGQPVVSHVYSSRSQEDNDL